MTYDYFYGEQSEQFSFYRVPKILFTGEQFRDLSVEAKVLYGLLLDRMSLSAKNGWQDDDGRVYIIFTTEEVMKAMNCADNKATKLMSELENKAGLITRCRQGLGKPSRIFVRNFISSEESLEVPSESRFKNRENHDSAAVQITIQDPFKSRTNNTDINDTEKNDTDPFHSFQEGREGIAHVAENEEEQKADRALRQRAVTEKFLKDVLEYDALIFDYPNQKDTLKGILDLMVDVLCSNKPFICVGGEDKPVEAVKTRLRTLNSDHIRYVLRCMKENTTEIRNMRQYLLTTLYNSSVTMDPYYQALVNHDMASGIITS